MTLSADLTAFLSSLLPCGQLMAILPWPKPQSLSPSCDQAAQRERLGLLLPQLSKGIAGLNTNNEEFKYKFKTLIRV